MSKAGGSLGTRPPATKLRANRRRDLGVNSSIERITSSCGIAPTVIWSRNRSCWKISCRKRILSSTAARVLVRLLARNRLDRVQPGRDRHLSQQGRRQVVEVVQRWPSSRRRGHPDVFSRRPTALRRVSGHGVIGLTPALTSSLGWVSGNDAEAPLETERLTLRHFTPDDVENLVELDGDPEVMRYINGGRATQRVWAETMVVHTASHRVMEKAGLRYVRTFHADWPDKIEGDEEGDLGYALTRAEWEERQTRSS